MRARIVVAWIAAAMIGLVLAAGITMAASQLSSQRIGLSGEPPSSGDVLVPRARRAPSPAPAARQPHVTQAPADDEAQGEDD
ncbi:MAG TPA: hypothetical protein VFY32_13925 [Solirubrobacteraceae bacterium]|jgi:hypothetical protein|nr:hypothetical protein [Solirubrobacteraceae bacterium]